MILRSNSRKRRGQGLVEYALLLAGIAVISLAAIAILGHKTSDLVATVAAIIPGAHPDDNAPITSGKLIETAPGADGSIAVDAAGIVANNNTARLGSGLNITQGDLDSLVTEAPGR